MPPIFPDHSVVRNDLLDYMVEVEHFDRMIVRAMATLEKVGRLDNTIIVITSDHGMPFPRAKASLYDAGSHVPLAIRWPKGIVQAGRVYGGLVNLSDLAPTFLEAAGLTVPTMMTANSLMDVLKNKPTRQRDSAYIAMERHDGCRKSGKDIPVVRFEPPNICISKTSSLPAGRRGIRIASFVPDTFPSAKWTPRPPRPCSWRTRIRLDSSATMIWHLPSGRLRNCITWAGIRGSW